MSNMRYANQKIDDEIKSILRRAEAIIEKASFPDEEEEAEANEVLGLIQMAVRRS